MINEHQGIGQCDYGIVEVRPPSVPRFCPHWSPHTLASILALMERRWGVTTLATRLISLQDTADLTVTLYTLVRHPPRSPLPFLQNAGVIPS